jgi:hypothetical protein
MSTLRFFFACNFGGWEDALDCASKLPPTNTVSILGTG